MPRSTKPKKQTAEPVRQPLLDLHVPQDPEGAVTATTPIAWCMKPGSQLEQKLVTADFIKPHLLLIVRHKYTDTLDREYGTTQWEDVQAALVPLTQGLYYHSFIRPGENQILAFVVDVPDGDALKQLRHHMERVQASYGATYFGDDGKYVKRWNEYAYSRDPAFFDTKFLDTVPDVLHVVVPAQMFAPEPAAWRKRTVARVFGSSTARDQCHFRKKFWFVALPLTPFIFVWLTLLKLFYFLVCVPGLAPRRLAWKKFLDPWAGPGSVINASPDANSWFFQKPAERGVYSSSRVGWQSLLSPYVLLGPSTLTYLLCHIPVHYTGTKQTHPWIKTPAYWKYVLTFDLALIGAVALVAGVAFVLGLATDWFDRVDIFGRNDEAKRRERAERERQKLLAELEAMACGDAPPPLSLRDLPADKRTVYLRYANLKTKVCKPFAR